MHRLLRGFMVMAAAAFLSMGLFACGDGSRETGAPGGGELLPSFDKRAQDLEAALSAAPEDPNLLVQLGNLYYDWGEDEARNQGGMGNPVPKWQKAIDYYSRALQKDPSNVNVRTDMANLLRYIGEVDQAIEQYRQGIKTDPNHPQARINLIVSLAESKQDYKGAVKEYEELIKAIPDQANNAALAAEVDKYRAMTKEAGK